MTAKTDGAAVEQPSRAGRVARGKDARAVAPLDSHAEFRADRSRDSVGLLLGQAQSRVPELVPVRHERMLVSAFTFYRGRRCRWRQTWPAHPGGDAVMSETARAQRPGAAQPGRQRNFGGREAGTVDE